MLTHDARQRYNPDERDAVMRSGVALFIHVGRMTHVELAESFVLQAPRIIRFRERNQTPLIAKIHRPEQRSRYRVRPGRIVMSLTFEEWSEEQRPREKKRIS